MALKSYEDLDYDIWQLQRSLIQNIKCKLIWKKIKSHPTDIEIKQQCEIPSCLNEQVDHWAKLAQTINYVSPAHHFPQAAITPFISNVCLHGSIPSHFKFHATQ